VFTSTILARPAWPLGAADGPPTTRIRPPMWDHGREMADTPTTEITRSTLFGDQLADLLRERIIKGAIPSGTHLVEDGVGAEYGVSRVPVRDALKQLQVEGFVVPRRKGMFAVGMMPDDVRELYAIRGALEGLALRSSIARPDTDWDALDRIVDDLAVTASRERRDEFSTVDLRFHSKLYELSGNRRLQVLWSRYEPTFRTLLGLTTREDADLAVVSHAHREIVALARRGDEEAAAAMLADHIDHACDLMLRSLSSVLPA